jgi:hypothetical protein
MLTRVAAITLIVLALSPFTAPFSTCDLLTLAGNHAPAPAPHSRSSLADPGASHLIPVAATLGRVRLAALAGASHAEISQAPAMQSPRIRPSSMMAAGLSESPAVLRI